MAYDVKFVIKDGSQSSVTKRYVLTAADFTAAIGQAATLRAGLAGVTAGSITKQTVSEITEYGYADNSTSKSSKAVLTAQSAAGKMYPFFVPMPDDSIFGDSGTPLFDVVDGTDANVIAYLDAVTSVTAYSDGETGALTFYQGKRIE